MNIVNPQTITSLLHEVRNGNNVAFNRLYENVYDELHRLAGNIKFYRSGETLNTTALVHEAYLKLVPSKDLNWQDRTHFFRVAARAMRQILIKQARYKLAGKRGSGKSNITFTDELYLQDQLNPEDLISLDQALTELEKIDPRQAKIVECRFFAGMSIKETAAAFGVSEPTVKRDWRLARAWLVRELGFTDNC